MMEWMPIETYPKDGKWVLIWQESEEHKISVAAYWMGRWFLADFDPGYGMCQRDVVATYWMPLPTPPTN